MKETSAGGVVVFGNAILLLRKFNGDWVLPKGRVEAGESLMQTALREVEEESGSRGKIIDYIGKAEYSYKNYKYNKRVDKTVHWYLMVTNSMETVPQKSEGFIEVVFVHKDRAGELLRYDDERQIIEKALKMMKES